LVNLVPRNRVIQAGGERKSNIAIVNSGVKKARPAKTEKIQKRVQGGERRKKNLNTTERDDY